MSTAATGGTSGGALTASWRCRRQLGGSVKRLLLHPTCAAVFNSVGKIVRLEGSVMKRDELSEVPQGTKEDDDKDR